MTANLNEKENEMHDRNMFTLLDICNEATDLQMELYDADDIEGLQEFISDMERQLRMARYSLKLLQTSPN